MYEHIIQTLHSLSDSENVLMTNFKLSTDSFVDSIKLPSLPPNCWIKANINQSGFYRVNYDTKNLKLLIKHLKDDLSSTVSLKE